MEDKFLQSFFEIFLNPPPVSGKVRYLPGLKELSLAFSREMGYNSCRTDSICKNTTIHYYIKGDTPMEMEKDMTPEEETSILTLTDENGEDIDFEYLDCLTYQDKEYLVLMPADEAETQIVILEVEPVDDENENYLAVDDEAVLDAVYGMFKEKYKDVLTFED